MTALQTEITALVTRQREQLMADLEATRQRLPLLDPDRHDLDTVDIACRHLAPTSDGGHA